MNLLTVSTDLISIFLFTTLFLFFARKVAKKVGLVDKPNFRKRHQGLIPLVGGISVYAGICFTFGIVDYYIPHASLYLACAGVLVFIGALDDRFDISVKIRATIQAAVGIVMMVFGKLYLSSLGYIFGSWEMVLGPFGYFLTLFAVWAAINAFNMVDGIDGLLGGLSCVSFAAIGMILWFDGQTSLAIWCFAMIAAILPYIMLNLGILGRRYKVFMGDAGSTLIGFTVIWILLETTQGKTHPISPVTALWIIAIPLMDMVAIMYRRLRKGMSPFSPDRQHIHHLIMRAGFTSRQAGCQRIPVGHVEAGLRTGDLYSPWPEEANRTLTGHLAMYHFSPTETSRQNLLRENVADSRIFITGNTVIDALLWVRDQVMSSDTLRSELAANYPFIDPDKKMILVTGHRRESFGRGFEEICQALADIATTHQDIQIVYPVHLNPNVREPVNRILGHVKNVILIDPQEYLPFVWLMNHAWLILTDSGGIQEEAPSLGKPVLVMRDTTERPEAVTAGTVRLVGTDKQRIVEEVTRLLKDENEYQAMSRAHNPYGDGQACSRILEALKNNRISL